MAESNARTPVILANHEGLCGAETAAARLADGVSALEAVEAGIRQVEDEVSVRTVGYGGAPNLLGVMECDAGIMDGTTLQAGAVGAVPGVRHPVSLARQVMERLPHILLVGEGASRFAAEIGAETRDMLSPEAAADYQAWLEKIGGISGQALAPLTWPGARPDIARGTTIYLARDRAGRFSAATSTSGWAYKYPGRLGDSPVIGAGFYADDRYGAAACTHTGEMTQRCATSRSVVLYMKKGASVAEACREAAEDLAHLQGGYLGPVVIHAMDRDGRIQVTGVGTDPPARYVSWSEKTGIREQTAEQAG